MGHDNLAYRRHGHFQALPSGSLGGRSNLGGSSICPVVTDCLIRASIEQQSYH